MSMIGANIDTLTNDHVSDIMPQLVKLRDAGCKTIRWAFTDDVRDMATWNTEKTDWWFNNKIWQFDQCKQFLYDNQMPVVLDPFHHPVGGMSSGKTRLFFNTLWYNFYFEKLKQVAEKYKNDDVVFAIEFINEPFPDSSKQLNDFYKKCCDEVRAIGFNKHLVLDHATAQIEQIKNLKPVQHHNIWYSAHIWPSFSLDPHAAKRTSTVSKTRSLLKPAIDWQRKYSNHLISTNSRILLGEFGCHKGSGKGANQAPYLRDVKTVANEQNWDWLWLGTNKTPFIWGMNDQSQWDNFWK